MRPTPRTPNQCSRRALLALTIALAHAHAQDLTTTLYPDDATRRAACETAMAHGEGARSHYQATIDDQQDRTVNPHVVAVNTPLCNLAFACENSTSQALDRTVDYLLTQELYASDDVTVVIAQLKVNELALMVDNYALLLAVDADGREVARLTPDPMRSSRIGAPPIPILDEASRIVWSGWSFMHFSLDDDAFRQAIVDGGTVRIEWRAISGRGVWEWPEAFGK